MSTTSKKVPIDPKSTKRVAEELTTSDMYREFDRYISMQKEEDAVRRRGLARQLEDIGPEMVEQIEEKVAEREEKRIEMVEQIYNLSQEQFISLKEAKDLPYEDLEPIYNNVMEWEKPWWRKIINVFR